MSDRDDLTVPVSLTFVGGAGEQPDIPAAVRARQVLKILQRRFGFRVAWLAKPRVTRTSTISKQYGYETDITWLQPTCTLPRYVRESSIVVSRRRGPIKVPGARVVCWANLSKDAPSRGIGHFERRVFWLAGHDPYEGSGAPCEAVDPFTVTPGTAGQMTQRAWGREDATAIACGNREVATGRNGKSRKVFPMLKQFAHRYENFFARNVEQIRKSHRRRPDFRLETPDSKDDPRITR